MTEPKNINPNEPFEVHDSPTIISGKLKTLYIETVSDTQSLIDTTSLEHCTRMVQKAKYIYICASGSQVSLSAPFQEKMLKIGKQVILCAKDDYANYMAQTVDETQSCFIYISYSGETARCLDASKVTKERKVPSIAITSFGGNSLSQQVDICLYMSSKEKLVYNLGAFGTYISAIYLLDVLYSACFNQAHEENKKALQSKVYSYEQGSDVNRRKSKNSVLTGEK